MAHPLNLFRSMYSAPLPDHKVVCMVANGNATTPMGRQEDCRASEINDPNFIGFSANTAGLVHIDQDSPYYAPVFRDHFGNVMSAEKIEARWGSRLREKIGPRRLDGYPIAEHVPNRYAAPLAHRLEEGYEPGGLLYHGGFTPENVESSELAIMKAFYQDDPDFIPPLQAQMKLIPGLLALGALPKSLSEIVLAPFFRVFGASCFLGIEAYHAGGRARPADKPADDKALRLSGMLATHGTDLINASLSPEIPIMEALKRRSTLERIRLEGSPLNNVFQAPTEIQGACASSILAAIIGFESLVYDFTRLDLFLLAAADAAMKGDGRILEMFAAAVAREIQEGRTPFERVAPLDEEVQAMLPGHVGGGFLFTTLDVAFEHELDVVGIVTGWGTSGETRGQHFAGVGFGGENALMRSFLMSHHFHGFGVEDYDYYSGHNTGTKVNTVTEIIGVLEARKKAAEDLGYHGSLPRLKVGAPKTRDGHGMGAGSVRGLQGISYYVMGQKAMGIPTFRNLNRRLQPIIGELENSAEPYTPSGKGAFTGAQGFGGPTAYMMMQPGIVEYLRRYRPSDEKRRDRFFERQADIRQERLQRESRMNRTLGSAIREAERHMYREKK